MPCYLVVLIPVNRQKNTPVVSNVRNSKDKKAKNNAVCLDYYWSKQIYSYIKEIDSYIWRKRKKNNERKWVGR